MAATTILVPAPPLGALGKQAQQSPEADLTAKINSLDRHGFLFGQKLAASLSPVLHSVVYHHLGLRWEQIRLDSTDMDLFLRLTRHPRFYGASITMPHKLSILPHLDFLTPECRAVGACNTIFLRPNPTPGSPPLLCGTNTDVVGVREAFLQNVPSPSVTLRDRPGLVIGGGGAARSAVYALRRWLGATTIYVANRDAGEVAAVQAACADAGYGESLVYVSSVAEAEAVVASESAGIGAVVSCVPDVEPSTPGEVLCRQVVEVLLARARREGKASGAMLEMCYNPSPYTALGSLAEREGWQVILGTEAMIWQGIEQDKCWTGKEASDLPVSRVHEVIAAKLDQHPRQ